MPKKQIFTNKAREFFTQPFFDLPTEGGDEAYYAKIKTYLADELYEKEGKSEEPVYINDWFNEKDIPFENWVANVPQFRQNTNASYLKLIKQLQILFIKLHALCKKKLDIDLDEKHAIYGILLENEAGLIGKLENVCFIENFTAVTFFNETKRHLEELVYLIEKNEYNEANAKSGINTYLKEQIGKCSDGLTQHIPNTLNQISPRGNIRFLMHNARLAALDDLALEFIRSSDKKGLLHRYSIEAIGMDVHYAGALVEGVSATLGISKPQEAYVSNMIKGLRPYGWMPKEIENFASYIDNNKIIHTFMNAIVAKFGQQLFAVSNYNDLVKFGKLLDKITQDESYKSEFFISVHDENKIENVEGKFISLRHEVKSEDNSSVFLDTPETLTLKLRSTLFTRLYNAGYINKKECIPFSFDIKLPYYKTTVIAYYCKALNEVVFSCDTFDAFKELSSDAQLEILNKIRDTFSVPMDILTKALLPFIKPETNAKLREKTRLAEKFYKSAIKQNDHATLTSFKSQHHLIDDDEARGLLFEEYIDWRINNSSCSMASIKLDKLKAFISRIPINTNLFLYLHENGFKDWQNMDLSQVNFEHPDIQNIKIPFKNFLRLSLGKNASTINASFLRKFSEVISYVGFSLKNFARAEIKNKHFPLVKFNKANFRKAKLTACVFSEIYMGSNDVADFYQATLLVVKFAKSRLKNIKFYEAQLILTFEDCELQNIDFKNSKGIITLKNSIMDKKTSESLSSSELYIKINDGHFVVSNKDDLAFLSRHIDQLVLEKLTFACDLSDSDIDFSKFLVNRINPINRSVQIEFEKIDKKTQEYLFSSELKRGLNIKINNGHYVVSNKDDLEFLSRHIDQLVLEKLTFACDLSDTDFTTLLSKVNPQVQVEFENCVLQNVSFKKANLQKVSFNNVIIKNSEVDGADFKDSVGSSVDLDNCSLLNVNLDQSKIRYISIKKCKLNKDTFNACCNESRPQLERFLREIIFDGDMQDTDFSNISWERFLNFDFTNNINLCGVTPPSAQSIDQPVNLKNFKNAKVNSGFVQALYNIGCRNFQHLDLSDAYLFGHFRDVDFRHCKLSERSFTNRAKLENCKFSHKKAASAIFDKRSNHAIFFKNSNTTSYKEDDIKKFLKFTKYLPYALRGEKTGRYDVKAICIAMLENEYLKKNRLLRFFCGTWGRSYINEVSIVLKELKKPGASWQSVHFVENSILTALKSKQENSMLKIFNSKPNAKVVMTNGELRAILDFCSELEAKNIRYESKQDTQGASLKSR